MRKFLGWLCILAWVGLCLRAGGAAVEQTKTSLSPKKAASGKKVKTSKRSGTVKGAAKTKPGAKAAGKTSAKAGSKTGAKAAGKKTTASKSGKKAPVRTTWRNRQTEPTPERYKQIQDALVAKGFLNPEDAGGTWGQSSADALKKFQSAQNIESTGKINSLSLIALGLGPKRDTGVVKPPEAQPQAP
jgi:hypothetical protein